MYKDKARRFLFVASKDKAATKGQQHQEQLGPKWALRYLLFMLGKFKLKRDRIWAKS